MYLEELREPSGYTPPKSLVIGVVGCIQLTQTQCLESKAFVTTTHRIGAQDAIPSRTNSHAISWLYQTSQEYARGKRCQLRSE